MITVCLVDDHELVRYAIRTFLSREKKITVLGEANTGEDAIRLVKKLHPHVTLMDVCMPGIGGFEAARKVMLAAPETKIIVISALTDPVWVQKFLRLGVAGYLSKEAGLSELKRAIVTVRAGKRFLSAGLAQRLALEQVHTDIDNPLDEISHRELQVMLMISEGYSPHEIADKLCLSVKTINTYRYRLYKKLDLQSDVELARFAIRYGIINLPTS